MASVPLPSQSATAEPRGDPARDFAARTRLHRIPAHAAVGVLLAIAGVVTVWPTALSLWSLWVTDPLKSIGGLIPVVSLVLILRAWRAMAWDVRGSWWGMAILTATAALVAIRDRAVLELVLAPGWSITLPPYSMVAVAYAGGIVLLLGGRRLWRAAWFPVALMWFVNPVPHVFNTWVDLPLQHASAEVARGLAHALGQKLSPDQLYLMFTPAFGMFIAPGCNGIRGSITMGLLALIAGYLYRFRLRVWAAVVAAAVLLGYVFNLLRLCVLVLYYLLALHLTWLQGHAELGDYIIGASLFFLATILLFSVIRRCSPDGTLRLPPVRVSTPGDAPGAATHSFQLRTASLAVLAGVCAFPYGHAMLRSPGTGARDRARAGFPAALGRYRLRRTWSEKLETGQTLFEWADYAAPGAASVVQVGVSPTLGAHDTLLCHTARGEAWLWHGTVSLATKTGPVSFVGAVFQEGQTDALEAATMCSGDRCGQWASDRRHLGLVYSRPQTPTADRSENARPVPLLLRVERADGNSLPDSSRAKLTADLQDFTGNATLGVFTAIAARP